MAFPPKKDEKKDALKKEVFEKSPFNKKAEDKEEKKGAALRRLKGEAKVKKSKGKCPDCGKPNCDCSKESDKPKSGDEKFAAAKEEAKKKNPFVKKEEKGSLY